MHTRSTWQLCALPNAYYILLFSLYTVCVCVLLFIAVQYGCDRTGYCGSGQLFKTYQQSGGVGQRLLHCKFTYPSPSCTLYAHRWYIAIRHVTTRPSNSSAAFSRYFGLSKQQLCNCFRHTIQFGAGLPGKSTKGSARNVCDSGCTMSGITRGQKFCIELIVSYQLLFLFIASASSFNLLLDIVANFISALVHLCQRKLLQKQSL